MKKSYVVRLGVLALALTLVTTCLTGGTLAKYTTDVEGTGSAVVAAWSFKANDQTATMTNLDLATTAYSNVATGKIAPGTEGSFAIKVDASGSDVAVDYAIKFSNLTNKPANLKFYSDAGHTAEKDITDKLTTDGFTGSIALADIANPVTETVYWAWEYGTAAEDDQATISGKTMTFDITVTGTQATPTATTPAT